MSNIYELCAFHTPQPLKESLASIHQAILESKQPIEPPIVTPSSDQTTSSETEQPGKIKKEIVGTISQRKDGWYVLDHNGNSKGGPYTSKEKAEERLKQVEMFKHMKKSDIVTAQSNFDARDIKLLESGIGRLGAEILKHPVAIDGLVGYAIVKDLVGKLSNQSHAVIPKDEGFWATPTRWEK